MGRKTNRHTLAGSRRKHMKYLKMLGLAAVAAMALVAFTAGSASATTLEVGGSTKNESITIKSSLKTGTSATLRDTFGFSSNTCTSSSVEGATENSFTGASLTGKISSLTFTECENEPVEVHTGGTLHVSHIANTTNGTVTSSGAEVTTESPFGTLNCKTGAGTHLGTLTGVSSGHATMDINATLSCSGISSKWIATYTVTSPTGLGVSA
jgi:hypothetical protein